MRNEIAFKISAMLRYRLKLQNAALCATQIKCDTHSISISSLENH